jgi:hypothetical protein
VDVAVCGGGPAGVAAALAAARRGAKTALIERNACLGGIWTAGVLSWLIDHENKPGIMREMLERITAMGGRAMRHGKPTNGCDVEKMKLLLDELCLEAGVCVRLYTQLVNAIVGEDRRVTHALVESKSGRQAIAARSFVDCTGDGDLGFYAGCGYDLGHPETGLTQPMSLIALVAGIDPAQVGDYFRSEEGGSWSAPKDRLRAEMERGGHSPSYSKPTLLWIRDDLFALMANHQYGVTGIRSEDLTEATTQARRELHALIDGLRSLGGIWAGLRIVATGAQIGVREGRRLHGRATVTAQDLAAGQRHDDAVCAVTFGVDVHGLDPKTCKGIEASPIRAKPYDIPLRALIARDIEGLVMAGRCISGDFLAHSSYRVTGNAVAMGEAAGQVAAVAALTGRAPSEVRRDEIAGDNRPNASDA